MSNATENRDNKNRDNTKRVNKYEWMPSHVHGASLPTKCLYFASITAYNHYRKNNLIKNIEGVNVGLDAGRRNASVIEVSIYDVENGYVSVDRWQYVATGEDSKDKHHQWKIVKTFHDEDFESIFRSIQEAEHVESTESVEN